MIFDFLPIDTEHLTDMSDVISYDVVATGVTEHKSNVKGQPTRMVAMYESRMFLRDNVEDWLVENQIDFTINQLDWTVEIKDETHAMMFKLTWL